AIIAALVPYVRADGANDDKRRALLEVRGLDRYETFDVFYPLVFPVRDGSFVLRVRPAGGGPVVTRTVGAIDLDARRAGMAASPDRNAPAWTVSFRDRAAVLSMPTWALYNSTWDWKAFLDETFAEIARTRPRALIVDVRGNEGGLDCGHEIIARLIDADLPLDADERRVRYVKTPPDLDPYLDTWDKSFRDWGDRAVARGDGFYTLQGGSGVSFIQPKGPRFTGDLIVLTDAQNSSATFQFAQLAQQRGLGRLVGGATGGNQRGINGGAFFFLRLPGSGLEADVPLIGRFPVTPRPDAGILPDVAVTDGPEDVAAGRDRALEAALTLAAR
ncbi:MAG: S41 family peptidase, partial [Hyphomonadaceae bacterium]|nr:S41 family peptidase [Hyphomonadaceae bacterium]